MAKTTTTRAQPVSPEVETFGAAIDDFMRAVQSARGRFNKAPVVPELSLSQFHLLAPLASSAEPLPTCALADAAAVAPPTATRMLDGLVERGLARRTRPAGGDRRRVEVALTEQGRELVEAKRARILESRAAVFERLAPSERKAAARLLHSLAAAVDELRP
jgi:DNA-binding MarR family transcriptional regulator